MIVQVEKFMRKWNMVPEGGRVLVGVSGGADSVCLCLILYELSTKMNFSLEVIHVEHGIRGEESKNDAVFVEQLCKQRGIVCHIRNVDVPRYAKIHHLGEEEAARILRYQVFADVAGQDRNVRIALAASYGRQCGDHAVSADPGKRTGWTVRDASTADRNKRGNLYPSLFAVQQGTDRTISGGAGAGILYGQYQCQRVLQQKPEAKEGASGTDTDESAGGTAYADGDGTAAAGKRLSGRRDGFPGEKIYFRGEEKCETGYGRAGRAFAGCPDAADPQSCLESCRGM